MKVTVELDERELMEFMAWREGKDKYEREENQVRREMGKSLENLATSLLNAIRPRPENPEEFEIVEQGHMSDAWDLAQDVFA
ncbi:MAG: hypothetical protein LKK00_01695 [Intestinimonas sp.]|jgi:hypothetical protein|nr:hypothetical protein [Intestinimonas sp.]